PEKSSNTLPPTKGERKLVDIEALTDDGPDKMGFRFGLGDANLIRVVGAQSRERVASVEDWSG
ncbi:Hypothetical predicted protein, partial [Olea europaea subsp. europaea]